MVAAPTFYIVPGSAVKSAIEANRSRIFEAIEAAYRLHAAGQSVNPDSHFLRFPDKPSSRIIALPAHLGGTVQKSGIKWIASFPENRAGNLARASAIQILNDGTTGYPTACIEASLISATRTAASAALAAERLSLAPFDGELAIVGTGVIARTTVEWLLFRGWKFRSVRLFDVDRREAERFEAWLRDAHSIAADVCATVEGALSGASLIVLTTTALEPYLADTELFAHSPTVLHLSLRDLAVSVVLASQNIVDDVDHCLKANTSLHLAEQTVGNRTFVAGTLVDVLDGTLTPDADRARIFSPFGLGVLDLAVSDLVLQASVTSGEALPLPDFFSNSVRW